MPIPLKHNAVTGDFAQFLVADALDIDTIEPRSGSHLVIGATLGAGDEVRLGAVGETVRIMGELAVDGSSTVTTNETVTGVFTANGDVNLGNNSGDTINLGGGTSDVVNLDADLVLGAGIVGIGSSVTDYLDNLWLIAVNDNGPDLVAYGLNASGTNAGAYSIGVDPALIANSSATDLMTMLDDLDAAIVGGGNDLQAAYALDPQILVTSGVGTIDFQNSTPSDTTTVLTVTRAPGSSTAGIGIDLQMGANATGIGLLINHAGGGNPLTVQDGGTPVFQITGAGRIEFDPTSGQDFELITLGAGQIILTSADAFSLSGGAASTISTSAGNLSLDAAAAELVFDDIGNSGITLSQASDRTLSQTAATEILSGATSIIGALNRIAVAVDADGRGAIESLVVENTVVIAAGDVIAQGTVSGRIGLWNGNSNTNSRFIGIALNGGTGDAGGTVEVRVAYPGNKITDSGASFTAGDALFGPDGTGRPTATAPSGTGDASKRIGWAHSSTEYVIDPGPTVIV